MKTKGRFVRPTAAARPRRPYTIVRFSAFAPRPPTGAAAVGRVWESEPGSTTGAAIQVGYSRDNSRPAGFFVSPLLTRRIDEHRVRRQFFEAHIDRPADRTGSMNGSCGNGDRLPRAEPQFGAAIKIDGQRTFNHEE
jgi:hypothetical protein